MVVTAAREIRDGELVFVGMRLPLLAFMLAQATHAPRAIGLYENGLVRRRAAEALLFTMSDPPNQHAATRATDMLEVMGLLQSGRVGVGFVGAAEVDRFGNLNTTLVRKESGEVRLPGSGGASDIASLSQRLVVLLEHCRHRLVERVGYVTSPGYGDGGEWRAETGLPGGGPKAVLTDRGVLRFDEKTKEAELASYHDVEDGDSPEAVSRETGWELKRASDCAPTEPPTTEELAIVRRLDPERFWLA